jgi:hypothetical protein
MMILRVTDDLGSRVNAGPNQAGTARPGRRPPTWVGVGQPPVRHSGRLPRLLPDAAIVSEPPARFAPFAAPFQQALANYGRSPLPSACTDPVTSCQWTNKRVKSSGPTGELMRLVALTVR